MKQQEGEPNLFSLSIVLGLPRVAGSPDEVARDVRRRGLAKLNNVVYVGSYLRRRPTRAKRSGQRAA